MGAISDFLDQSGVYPQVKRSRYNVYLSPLSDESSPSFVVWHDSDRFKCFSTGAKGDVYDLIMKIKGCTFSEAKEYTGGVIVHRACSEKKREVKTFDLNNYLEFSQQVIDYAASRRIYEGFLCGKIWIGDGNKPAMCFPHTDGKGNIVGAKFRNIDNSDHKLRFTSRGSLMYYILEHRPKDEPVFIFSESETSSNAVYSYLKSEDVPCVICSFGAVSSRLPAPEKYDYISRRYVIIDYDGNEELYKQRLEFFKDYKDIKLELPKGEDLSSLWQKNILNQSLPLWKRSI
jgi:hypothetical protein